MFLKSFFITNISLIFILLFSYSLSAKTVVIDEGRVTIPYSGMYMFYPVCPYKCDFSFEFNVVSGPAITTFLVSEDSIQDNNPTAQEVEGFGFGVKFALSSKYKATLNKGRFVLIIAPNPDRSNQVTEIEWKYKVKKADFRAKVSTIKTITFLMKLPKDGSEMIILGR